MRLYPKQYEIYWLCKSIDNMFNEDDSDHERSFAMIRNRIARRLQELNQKSVVSERTIRRIYDHDAKCGFNEASLSDCVKAIGYNDWADFQQAAKNRETCFPAGSVQSINVETMHSGTIVLIGWPPHKYVKLKYLGDWEFQIMETAGLKRCVGDIIEASGFAVQESSSGNIYPDILLELGDECGELLDKNVFDFDELSILVKSPDE